MHAPDLVHRDCKLGGGVQALETAIRVTYETWDTGSQSVWEPPPPTVAGS